MSVCALPNAQGFLAVTDTPLSECSGYIAITVQDYDYLMSYTRITAFEAGEAFGYGFALVFGFGYLSIYAVYIAKKIIRLI